MKIATWNIERLGHRTRLVDISSICNSLDADILVLTEADNQVELDYEGLHETEPPSPYPMKNGSFVVYKESERRVLIYSRYPFVKQHPTCDPETALCWELETPKGNLLVYGTILGVLGIGGCQQEEAIEKQSADIKGLVAAGYNLCVCGDFNCSFAGNYCHTKFARSKLAELFAETNMSLVTADGDQRIDHIAISNAFLEGAAPIIQEGELDKGVSDHR